MKKKAPNKSKAASSPVAEKVVNSLSDILFGGALPGVGTQIMQFTTLAQNLRTDLISNQRFLLSQIYIEHGIIRTIVDVPIEDAFRGGIEIKTKMLDEEEIKELEISMDKNGDLEALAQSKKWARLFGGGAVIAITEDAAETELKIQNIKKDQALKFKAVDLWELYGRFNQYEDQRFTELKEKAGEEELYDHYGIKVHKSRVIRQLGTVAPSFIRPRLRGWGLSVMESVISSINQFLKANDLTFEVLDEFKIDVYKIKGLNASLLSPDGTTRLQKRFAIANSEKNYRNAITMDAEDDYAQKQVSFAGISETMDAIRLKLASDLRMPMTKLYGISSAGFSSGEDDIENYNSMIESHIRSKTKFDIIYMAQMRAMQLFGVYLEDLQVNFKPLRVISSEIEQTIKDQKFNRVIQARNAGEISSEEFRDACNKDELLPLQLSVDKNDIANLEKEKKIKEKEGEKK